MTAQLVRCPQGHFFDLAGGSACPICGESVALVQVSSSKVDQGTEGADVGHTGSSKFGSGQRNGLSTPMLAAAGVAGVATIGLAAFLLWPSPPSTVPPHEEDHRKTTAAAASDAKSETKEKQLDAAQGDSKSETSKTTVASPQPTPPSPNENKQVMLDKTPAPAPIHGQAQLDIDLRDAIALSLEEKYKFSPLGRELLATSRGCFASGRGEYALAKSWMMSDVAKSNPATMYWYALMLEKGNGVPQDYAEALKVLTSSAEAGFYYSQFRLAEIYLKGIYPSVSTDPAKGRIWLVKAARESRPEALRLAAETGLKADDFSPNVALLDKALGQSFQDTFKVASTLLKENTTSGIFWTGTLTFYGQGTKRDEKQGRDLILRAARLYAWQALIDVANWSANGYEMPKNPVEAAALAYLARENILSPNETEIVDKAIAPLTAALTAEQYQDLGALLRGITSLPARSN